MSTTTLGRRRQADSWLPYPDTDAGVRLYCLPHAGGSASAFRPWIGHLPGVAVRPVQPPGRDTRLGDAPHTDMAALTAELAEVILADAEDRPYAVYGHSLGALVAFEVLRTIDRIGGPGPAHLLISGCRAPHLPASGTGVRLERDMSQDRIVAWLRGLGGTPEAFLSDPRALAMILAPIRADLVVKNSYRYDPAPPLEVPITALASTDDPQADAASVGAWRELTVGRCATHTLPGGHFAVFEQAEATLQIIHRALRP
ncbi:thioesterase [Actinospica durhamensis]|uniref:Thioesterase n=1 Tax=Actinospica durhamensis TaxID=1508375 RepID=A0A941ELV1_9ACTN|nr:alpha/beta fold hydrolase [Actinospica durhamensis]MBR7833511.1 thioesterase [Actinospica durhamensis]